MTEKEHDVFHKQLYVYGFSRILWISKLSKIAEKNGSAKIRVYWAEVCIDASNPALNDCPVKPGAEIKSVDLPIGYLTLLHINAIFYRGYIVISWPDAKLPFEQRTKSQLALISHVKILPSSIGMIEMNFKSKFFESNPIVWRK